MEYSCWSVGESMTSYKSSWWHKVNKSGAYKFLNWESLSSDESSQQHTAVSQLKSQEVYWQTRELKEISWELPHARSTLVNWGVNELQQELFSEKSQRVNWGAHELWWELLITRSFWLIRESMLWWELLMAQCLLVNQDAMSSDKNSWW